jgi:ribosomal protein L30, bacterial/organelle
MAKTIKITQTRSSIGRLPKHKATLVGLGLRRIGHTVRLPKHKATLRGLGLRGIGHTVEREDTPAMRGMVNQVYYMVKVEE